jgi:PAS domain-containing protein
MQDNQQKPKTPDGMYVASTVQASNINFSQLIVALIGFAGISLAAYFGLQGQASSNQTAELAVFIQSQIQVNDALSLRLSIVEAENKALTQLNTLQTIQIASMKAIDSSRRQPEQIYADFVLGMPIPAWLKAPGPNNTFVMIQVNAEFTARYGFTQAEFKGKTDFDFFPEDLAAGYRAVDRKVARTGTPAITQEYKVINGKRELETSIKFRVMLENGVWGVAGFVFP